MIPQDLATPGLSLIQIWSILRAYRLQALIIAATIILATGVLLKLAPRTYTATATLIVNTESNDPLAGGQTNATPLYNYMSTESQLMQSTEVLLPVIEQLNLTKNPDYTAGYRGDGSTLRDWVKEALVKDLDIQLGAYGSQLIYVTASARSGELAANIANTLAQTYLSEERQRLSGPASERAKRYAAELAELKDKVRIAQDQVTAFRQRTGITDTSDKDPNMEETLLSSLQSNLQLAQNARRAAEVKSMADQNLSAGAAGSLAVQNLKAQLNSQQEQLAQLRTTFGSQHPKVIALQSQIQATQHSLNAELGSYSSGASSDLTASRQLEAKLAAAVEDQRNKALATNKLRDEGTKYELEFESAQSVYKRALDGYDQIMFASGASAGKINIVSSAIVPQKPAKPNKVKLMFLGSIFGIFVALVSPLIYELLLNRRIRCRDDFERSFSIPVLIEFDRILPTRSAA